MYTVTKNKRVQKLLCDTQLAAYLNAGWTKTENCTEESVVPIDEPATNEPELDIDALKAEADALGISYMPNIGPVKLKRRIEEHEANGRG